MARLSGIVPGDWITMGARQHPERRCFVRADGRETSWAEVDSRVTRLARGLLSAGLEHGDRIAILDTDSQEYMELLMASMKAGTTAVPLNFRLSMPEIANLLRASQPRAIVTSSRYAAAVDLARESSPDLRLVFGFDEGVPGATRLDEVRESTAEDSEMASLAQDEDILTLALTSGTTGTPKGVLQSHRMIKEIIKSGVFEMQFTPGDFLYSGAALFHVSGMGHILYGLSRGCTSLILPQFDAAAVHHWMTSGGLNHCMLVPSMLISLLEQPGAQPGAYPSLRRILYGGAPMPPAVLRRVIDVFGCDLFNGFGAGTECGGQTMLHPHDHRRALAGEEHILGSIGRPIYGIDVRICDEDGVDVPRGEVGEIVTRSDTVMSGYLGQPELTAKAVRDGWFHGGDMAWQDVDGLIYLAGRKDDMIIRNGENVYPVEIESTLADIPAVLEVAVIGAPDPVKGEIVVAVVALREGSTLTLEEVIAHCSGRLAGYKVPARLVVVDDFPRNSTGKIQKSILRRGIDQGQRAAASTGMSR